MALHDSVCDFFQHFLLPVLRPHCTEQKYCIGYFIDGCRGTAGNLENRIDFFTNFPFVPVFKTGLIELATSVAVHELQADRIIFVLYFLWTVIMSLPPLFFWFFFLFFLVGIFCFVFFFFPSPWFSFLSQVFHTLFNFESKWFLCSLQRDHNFIYIWQLTNREQSSMSN